MVLEAHRRSLWQVLAVYIAASWIAYEMILGVTDGAGLPRWVPGFALVLFIIGLPVVLATAIVQEGGPAGAGRAPEQPARPADAPPPGDSAATDGVTPPSPGRRHLTWRRVGLAGAVTFGALAMGTAGFMGMRVAGIGPAGTLVAKGELEAREPLVVADFEPLTGDSSLAIVVAEGVRTDLAQSAFVTAADRPRVREALSLMMRPAEARLDAATAREVAVRLGLKAVIEGDVARAGPAYVLTARVVTADSGRTLAAFRETAADSTRLLAAIEGLARALRERIGESLRAVRASAPLAEVTTSSLPALRKWSQAVWEEAHGARPRAIRLLNEAVALDPGFASAWAALAVLHYNNGNRDATLRTIRQALGHEDRLDERQRHRVRGLHGSITGDFRAAVREQGELAALDPTDATAQILLSDATWNLGEWAAAVEHAERAIELGTPSWVAHWNLVVALLDGGRPAEARAAAAEAVAALPAELDHPLQLTSLALAAQQRYDSVHAINAGSPLRAALADRVLGRWAEVQRHAREDDFVELARAWAAVDRLFALGDAAALDWLEANVDTLIAAQGIAPERPIAELALTFAVHGRGEAARRTRDTYLARVPEEVRWADAFLLHAIEAFLALDEGRTDEALDGLRRARDASPWTAPVDALLGRAFERIERPDSAIAAYERYVTTGWSDRIGFFNNLSDPLLLVPSHERLAWLYADADDDAAAARHAAAVVQLWGDADAELQPRVAAMRRLLERLGGEGRIGGD